MKTKFKVLIIRCGNMTDGMTCAKPTRPCPWDTPKLSYGMVVLTSSPVPTPTTK